MVYFGIAAIQIFWLVGLYISVVNWRRGNAIARRRPGDISTAVHGQHVLFIGRAASERAPTHTTTLGNVSCVWHSWQVDRERERSRLNRKEGEDPTEIYLERQDGGGSTGSFILEDKAGIRALIVPDKASFEATQSRTWVGFTPRPVPDGTPRPFQSPVYIYSEWWLSPGDEIFVSGQFGPPSPDDLAGIHGRVASGGPEAFMFGGGSPGVVAASLIQQAKLGAVVTFFGFVVTLIISWSVLA